MERFLLAVVRFPLTRIILGFAWVLLVLVVVQLVLNAARLAMGISPFELPGAGFQWLSTLFTVPIVTLAYWSFVRVVEQRPVTELSLPGALQEYGVGMLVGGGLMAW